MAEITQQQLLNDFEYKDGILYNKKNRKRALAGQAVGSLGDEKYLSFNYNGKHVLVHRMVFLMFNGYLPKQIDHIDRNKTNNKIENLRQTNHSENACNRKIPSSNVSGVKGVRWYSRLKKWAVQVKKDKKLVYWGLFEDLELAELVAQEARNKFHKEFAYHG